MKIALRCVTNSQASCMHIRMRNVVDEQGHAGIGIAVLPHDADKRLWVIGRRVQINGHQIGMHVFAQ